MKKEEKLKVGRPRLANADLKKKSVIISCICLVVALALLITGAFELNILKFNSKKLKGTVNTSLCGDNINIIPEELRYSETNPDGFKDIKFYSAVLSAGGVGNSTNNTYNSSEYCSTITKEDLEKIEYLDASNSGLTDVSGIGYLTGLESLGMSANDIQSIDLNKNSLLNGLDLSSNSISDINLKNNTNLLSLRLSNNQLTNIEGIESLINLKQLVLDNNKLTNLDLSSNNQLTLFSINNNLFKNIVLDNLNTSRSLSVFLEGSNDIESLSMKNTNIDTFSIKSGTKIKNLDISNNNELTTFSINDEAQIDNLIVENLNNLNSLNLSGHSISSVSLDNLPKLINLYLNDNELTSIDISNLTRLARLELNNNKISSLDLSNLYNLGRIRVNNNNLDDIKFAENTDAVFTIFDLSNNNLSGNLDLSNLKFNTILTTNFDLSNNNLESIILPSCNNRKGIDLSNNKLNKVEFAGVINTKSLNLNNNQLTSIDLSNLTGLTRLELENNKLTSIDLSDLTKLYGISLINNELTGIDVSNLRNISWLYLDNNKITKVEGLQNLNKLEELFLHKNKLESIDLSGMNNLYGLSLQNNPMGNTKYLIKGESIDYKALVNGDNITYNTDNQNVGTFDGSILNLKEVGILNVTISKENIESYSNEYIDKCMAISDYNNNQEYCDNVNEEDYLLPYFYENKVIVYDVLSNNYKVDSNNKTIDVSGLIPDTKYITLTEGFTGEIKNNKYIVKNSNNEVIEEFEILNPGKKEEEVKKVTTISKGSSKRVIKPSKKVTTKKLEDINLTGSFISSLMLNRVKGQDRKLTVTNEDVVLTMLGKDIKKVDSNIDISYKVTNVKETEVKDKVENGIVLEFMNKSALPGVSQIEVNVKDKIKGNVDIYRYSDGSLTLIAENVKINNNKLAFNTDKLDTYVITNKLKKDVTVKEDKGLIESNDKIKKNNNCLIVIPIVAIILLIGIGTYIYKKKMAK